jgi:error-prone DNA polymerase
MNSTPKSSVYVELQVTTHFSFLRGVSSAEELFAQAAYLGIPALGIADRNSVAGVVRAWEAAKTTGVRLIPGCRLDLACGTSLLAYPTDRAAWSRLTRLLTLGKARAGKGKCKLHWEDVADWSEGLIAILVPDLPDDANAAALARLSVIFGMRGYMGLALRRRPNDAMRIFELDAQAREAGLRSVVLGDVLYHSNDRKMLQDVVTAIRHRTTIDALGFRRERYADRQMKSGAEMERRFARYPDALAATADIAAACRFDLGQLEYQYPQEASPGETPQALLERLTSEAAGRMFPDGVPDAYAKQLRHELRLIDGLSYAPYFLTVNSIVAEARRRKILCQGRGSAANSCVCFVLGITSIDPIKHELLFERFVSGERKEPPDIDVDFEHERREEIIQWIYETYGRTRAALTAVVTRYRARGAVREVGKALGLPEDMTAGLAGLVWGWSVDGVSDEHARELNLDTTDPRLALTLELSRELIGTPRHLSQHPGGFVLTSDRLDELVRADLLVVGEVIFDALAWQAGRKWLAPALLPFWFFRLRQSRVGKIGSARLVDIVVIFVCIVLKGGVLGFIEDAIHVLFAARRKAVQPRQRQFLLKLQDAPDKSISLGLQCLDLGGFRRQKRHQFRNSGDAASIHRSLESKAPSRVNSLQPTN